MPMNLPQIRETLLRLNNPEVPVEERQRALTSLCVELIDRVLELTTASGAAVKRLTEQVEGLATPVQELVTHLQSGAQQVAPVETPATPAPAPAPAAKADGNGKKKATVAAVPPAPEGPIAPPAAPPVAAGAPALATVQTKVIQG